MPDIEIDTIHKHPDQPDGIIDESHDMPDPTRAAERIREYVSAVGDGLYDVADDHPLYGRDLEAVTRAVAEVTRLRVQASNYAHDRDEARQERDQAQREVEQLNAELDTISRLTSSVPEADRHESASDKVRSALNAVTKRNNALRHDLDCARESYHRARRERDEARRQVERLDAALDRVREHDHMCGQMAKANEAMGAALVEARQEARQLRAVNGLLTQRIQVITGDYTSGEDDCHCDDPCCEVDVGVGVQTCGSYHCPVHGAHTKAPTPEPETAEGARPSPHELWQQANGDGDEYRRLMRRHGHLIDAKPGDDTNLPCGWPGRRVADEAVSTDG